MTKIIETKNFIVEAMDRPHITRTDGGHIRILPKKRVKDRTKLDKKRAVELMRITMIVGEAMAIGMNKREIDIGRINYQENGNWGVFKKEGPYLHVHVYGRAKSAKIQKYGEAMNLPQRKTGFYDSFEPLNEDDISEIKKHIEKIQKKEKYKKWN